MDQNQTTELVQAGANCVICNEGAQEITPCSHGYCWSCLAQLIRVSCQDGQRWPPRCCPWEVNFDSAKIQQNIPADLIKLVEESRIYYSTRGKLFCCQKDCRQYIAPKKVDEYTNVGFCSGCWAGTCALCRRNPHVGPCRKDFLDKLMEKVLVYKGWKRCEQCGGIVEKATGCNHMTCTCGEEFCYICGEHWRHCDCPQFGDHKPQDHKVNAWSHVPQVPRCYGKEFLVNTCLPQTFSCARCEHRCGKSGESSYQCQECGRHLCRSCVIQCVDNGRYRNPDWNAKPAETYPKEEDPQSPASGA